jgi:hypothetical protein
MGSLLDAKNEEEFIEAVYESQSVIDFVPRKLLIQVVGVDHAQRFLPTLPEYVAVNTEELLLVLKLTKEKELQAIIQKNPHE